MKTFISMTAFLSSVAFAQSESPSPNLPREEIRQAIRKNLKPIKECYQAELKNSPDLSGKLVVNIEVNDSGRAHAVTVKKTNLYRPNMENCVLDVIRSISFPQAPQGLVTVIDYPFSFGDSKK